MRETFEQGDSLQFTFVCSVVPDAAPYLAVTTGNSETLVQSQTAVTSGPLSYFVMQTMSLEGVYVGEWGAQKTVAGTPYPFRKRFTFNVYRTRRGEA